MSSHVPTREEAYQLLTEHNKNDSLIKHALAVEGVMRHFARKYGEDEQSGVLSASSMISTMNSILMTIVARRGKFLDPEAGQKNTFMLR